LDAGNYIARVELVDGQLNLADQLCLLPNTPTAEAHWSCVKALYR